MIIRHDASSQFFFDWRDGSLPDTAEAGPMTEGAGHVCIKPGIRQIYRLTGTIADTLKI